MDAIARIHDLRKISKNFYDKSLACTKISDIRAFFELAQQASADADALEADLKVESCWVYLHFVQFFGYSPEYTEYLEFCVRNRFDPVSDTDYRAALSYPQNGTEAHNANDIPTITAQ